ncbi:MAG: molybdopterin synthase sulfur carrier subunit [Chloroflexi bacterium B3_Chlor]|nr:MAG: molybdopterin synthase sulfur carrier subunit [Chloroflexi bacterium B3_Chlor]
MRVRIYGTLRPLVGATEVEVEASGTVREVLQELTAEYSALKERVLDDAGNLQSSINVLVNGRSIRFLDGLNTTVQEGDELALFPPVGGG